MVIQNQGRLVDGSKEKPKPNHLGHMITFLKVKVVANLDW